MSNVIVSIVEWDKIRCFTHRWHDETTVIDAIYTLTEAGKELTMKYQWSPSTTDDTIQYPWLLQEMNGPWILADVAYKCSGKPLPASWVTEASLKQLNPHKQRYYH